MAKWEIILSTTERNHVGLMKMRKGNSNTEVIEAQITTNNKPHDLTGLDIYFNAYFDRFIPVEQRATIIDAKKGIIRYTLNKYDLHSGLKFAYFSLVKGKDEVGSTQNFAYQVIDSLYQSCADAETYIIRLEEALDAFSSVKETSMAAIQKIIESFNEQVLKQQEDFEKWFKQIKDIIEDIDPGGKLLLLITDAMGEYDTLAERLQADKDAADLTNKEVVEARRSSQAGLNFQNLGSRLDHIETSHYTLPLKESMTLRTLADDKFSTNYDNTETGKVVSSPDIPGLVIAEIGNKEQDTFYLRKVGEI